MYRRSPFALFVVFISCVSSPKMALMRLLWIVCRLSSSVYLSQLSYVVVASTESVRDMSSLYVVSCYTSNCMCCMSVKREAADALSTKAG